MKAGAATPSRPAGIALGVAAVLVLGPLLAGAVWNGSDLANDAAVVDLRQYRLADDQALSDQLDKKKVSEAGRVIVIRPGSENGEKLYCPSDDLPKSCALMKEIEERTTTVSPDTDPIAVLAAFGGSPEVDRSRVTIVHLHQGHAFGWWPALEVGLLMTIIAAGSFFFLDRSARRRRLVTAPAYSVPPPPTDASRPEPQISRSVAVPSAAPPAGPAPRRRPPPRPDPPAPPGPLPADVVGAVPIGRQVVARTHFGPGGGFVDIGGVVVWASLEQPGEPVYPGRRLSVLSMSAGVDSLVVSSRVSEEVRP
ncbi:hypothetical protein ACQP2F_36180 [Actinoplanes sp. CA-030573]|uniref:hypothetical protein n=1 Tax=Actinoplanes sp. CA-030573 TaxID=3239898 RepID=UPI003D920B2E